MKDHVTKYKCTVSVFFFRVKDPSGKDRYLHKCKACRLLFPSAPEAKDHFENAHLNELQRAAEMGYIESRIIMIHEPRPVYNALISIRKHRDEILRKIDRDDLLEVLR